jgi:serine/threonine protein phosphatase PrpC
MSLDIAFKTDQKKDAGETGDSFFHKNDLFIVANGLGDEVLANEAKSRACDVINQSFFRCLARGMSPGNALIAAVKEANNQIMRERKRVGRDMAASVSIVYIKDGVMYFTHLGDSRVYCLHDGAINQLTRDHTLLEEDPLAAKDSRDAQLMQTLTEGLGIHDKPAVKVKKFALQQKDVIVMTTNGLTSGLSNRDILRISSKTTNVRKLCGVLTKAARDRGAKRDVTVGIIRFGRFPSGLRKSLMLYGLLVIVILAVMAGFLLKYGFRAPEEKEAEVVQTRIPPEKIEVPVPPPEDEILAETQPEPPAAPAPTVEEEPVVAQGEPSPGEAPQEVAQEPPVPSDEEIETGLDSTVVEDDVFLVVEGWRMAWEQTAGKDGDIEQYMSYYSDEFRARGLDREGWKKDKDGKNRRKQWIKVELRDVEIKEIIPGERFEVRFSQDYTSSNFSVSSKKMLVLKKEEGAWRIIIEKSI